MEVLSSFLVIQVHSRFLCGYRAVWPRNNCLSGFPHTFKVVGRCRLLLPAGSDHVMMFLDNSPADSKSWAYIQRVRHSLGAPCSQCCTQK
jgi:hypothetical protein